MTLHEVLDHALFGPQELDLAPMFGNFPLQTVVEPVPSAPGLDDIAWYHRHVLNNSLRRSTRHRPAASVPDEQGSLSPVVSTSESGDSDSDWETMFQPEPVAAADAPQRDHHVQAWIAVHASRHRPRPAVGRPFSSPGNIEKVSDIPARSNTVPIEPVDGKWLQGLSRFGPPPDDPCVIPNTFDRSDQVAPPWLEQLHEESVNPTAFLDLWRDDWQTSFKPLYSETPKWQRLWRNGQGTPQRGFFVSGGVMFRAGCYCDRLCVPCPDARIEILRGLHDSALAGHNGVHKTACRVQERY